MSTETKMDKYAIAEKAIADWKSRPEIRAEFSDVVQYQHYLEAEANGQVKIIGKA